jgi:hypothetical protein
VPDHTPADSVLVALPDGSNNTTLLGNNAADADIEVKSDAPDCAAGQFEIVTYQQTFSVLNLLTNTLTNQGFSFLVTSS